MNKKTTQISKSGDDSTIVQVETVNVQQGFSYSDVKDIALDVFKENFLELSQEASQIATIRAEEITNNFIEKLKKEKSSSLEFVNNPGFQYILYEAQKNYAKTGDKDMSEVLIDILIDRIDHQERDLKQIVLDESISVVPKLTASQMDTLTIIFLLKYSVNNGAKDTKSFRNYLETNIKPFTDSLSKENSLYQHLEFAGCGSIGMGSNRIEDIFSNTYRGHFYKGFEKNIFEEQVGATGNFFNEFTTICLNDSSRFELNVLNEDALNKKINNAKLDENISKKLKSLFGQHIYSNDEVKSKLIEIGKPFLEALIDLWNHSFMKNMSLTSVGIAIAQANYRRKTGLTLDLSIWIK